jgi:hypothetical protein
MTFEAREIYQRKHWLRRAQAGRRAAKLAIRDSPPTESARCGRLTKQHQYS